MTRRRTRASSCWPSSPLHDDLPERHGDTNVEFGAGHGTGPPAFVELEPVRPTAEQLELAGADSPVHHHAITRRDDHPHLPGDDGRRYGGRVRSEPHPGEVDRH